MRRRGFLADRPRAVAALTKKFLDEIERLLLTATHHVHLHVCATDGFFVPAAAEAGSLAPPTFLPALPITQADLAPLTERVRRRVIRWFRMQRLLDAAAAAEMLAWENSGFSVDASVRITLARIRYVLPRHKAANWVGPGGGRKSRVFAPNHKLRRAVTALAIGTIGRQRDATPSPPLPLDRGERAPNHDKPRAHDTSRIAWAKLLARVGEEFSLLCPACGGDIRLISFIREPGPIRKILTHLGEPLEPPPVSPARGPPTDQGELVQLHDDRDVFQSSPDELPAIDIHSL